jgi:toxin-antitoxin system PIN domain toxin
VKLVDANVLLYAVNVSDSRHQVSRRWLDGVLNGADTAAFSWPVLLAFMRLSTKHGVFPTPLSVEQALTQVRAWLGEPTSILVEPTGRHLDILAGLLSALATGGNIVSDAHLAALAVEHGATVVTFDSDFGRFPGVRWALPA